MARVRFRHSSAGFRAVMRSNGVRADLERRAEQIAAVAGPQFADEDLSGEPVTMDTSSYVGTNRASASVAAVHPAAMVIEQRKRILGGAIDAAGD